MEEVAEPAPSSTRDSSDSDEGRSTGYVRIDVVPRVVELKREL